MEHDRKKLEGREEEKTKFEGCKHNLSIYKCGLKQHREKLHNSLNSYWIRLYCKTSHTVIHFARLEAPSDQ